MTFTVATHNARKGKANFPQIASVVVRQEMWAKKARRRLAKVPGTTSWYGRYGLTVTWRSDEWTPGAGASWRAHKGRAGITPQRGVARKFLTHDDGTEVAVFAVHHINGARHNKWKFARTSKFRESRWVMAQRLLERKVAETRRTHPGAVIVVAGDFNADDPHLLDLKRRGHRIDWLFWDSARLDAFDVLGKHGSDHPMLRARFTPKEATMRSQNGWPVHTSSSSLAPLDWITGRVDPTTVAIFDYLCRRFDAEVEPIRVDWSWGYAYRAIRGRTSGYSNHASGTAIDLNAPAHPLGKRGTFTPKQATAIRRILADLDGAIRWGGNYSGRKDEMHFEVNVDADDLARVAKKITQPEDDMANYADQLDRIEKKLKHIDAELGKFRDRERARDAADKRRANQIKKLLRDVPEEIVIAVIDAANADQEDAS